MENERELILNRLKSLSEEKYRKFSAPLIPGVPEDRMLGVRIPLLRRLAAELCRGDWRRVLDMYDALPGGFAGMEETTERAEKAEPTGTKGTTGTKRTAEPYLEECLLQGLVTAGAKMDLPERLERVVRFVPRIDNWAVCDVFVSGCKWAMREREAVWAFIRPYVGSQREFEVRFGVVMMMSYFLDQAYIDGVLERLDGIAAVRSENRKHTAEQIAGGMPPVENYYTEMAVAWCLATAFAKCRTQTRAYLMNNSLSDTVLKRTVRKMCESYRVSAPDKEWARSLVKRTR